MDGNVRGYGNLLEMSELDIVNAEREYWAQVNEDYNERERQSAIEYPED